MKTRNILPQNFRDVLIKPLTRNKFLVVGCDSCGAIGPKIGDVIKVDGSILGKFAVRTALMEVMAVGAKPICVACGLGVEPKPTGESIIEGVLSEIRKVGLDQSSLVISTEKNFETTQTSMGVSVIGLANLNELKMGQAKDGDLIISLGVPSVGIEVLENEQKGLIADLEDLMKLLSLKFVHSVIPVGSKGIFYEMKVLAKEAEANLKLNQNPNIDMEKSAGPATVILAAISGNRLEELKRYFKKPINLLARLEK
ncbi:MAG: AIR synthase related protein [Candidatus Bathyarchaeia archaeon]